MKHTVIAVGLLWIGACSAGSDGQLDTDVVDTDVEDTEDTQDSKDDSKDEDDTDAVSDTDVSDTDAVPTSLEVDVVASVGATVDVGGATLVIPAGALAADTRITMRVVEEAPPSPPSGRYVASPVVTLTPHGLAFSTPATLSLPFDGPRYPVTFERLDDESDTTWTTIPATYDGRMNAEINGFSLYTTFSESPPAGNIFFYISAIQPCEDILIVSGGAHPTLPGDYIPTGPIDCLSSRGLTLANRYYGMYSWTATCGDKSWSGTEDLQSRCIIIHLD